MMRGLSPCQYCQAYKRGRTLGRGHAAPLVGRSPATISRGSPASIVGGARKRRDRPRSALGNTLTGPASNRNTTRNPRKEAELRAIWSCNAATAGRGAGELPVTAPTTRRHDERSPSPTTINGPARHHRHVRSGAGQAHNGGRRGVCRVRRPGGERRRDTPTLTCPHRRSVEDPLPVDAFDVAAVAQQGPGHAGAQPDRPAPPKWDGVGASVAQPGPPVMAGPRAHSTPPPAAHT